MADELGAVADELYGLPASDFTAARNAAAKTAKAKDRDLAAAITALPKPSTSAWVVNQLVRQHPDDVDALLELGDDLRSAERARDPDRIRSLSRERNLRVPALTRQAKALAEERGQPVSASVAEEIESTLTAALATEEFGTAVRSGRLTKALVWAGFGEMPALASLVAVPSPAARPKPAAKGKSKDDAAAKAAAEGAEREAAAAAEAERRAAEERERELTEAREAAAEADRRVEELTATVDDLTQQLEWAKKQLTSARREAKSAARLVRDLS
ncbi:hypothetical protein [Sporichthya polymorpha]|uniref:hypothetical protein n=1 Tax=Sporichthya polymorpha TaxID=35751 RepID=UPI00036E0385|nr:hypothetical protein [Sporichthya polymorpha]